MPRSYCSRCQFPLKTCLCSAIQAKEAITPVLIIQHTVESQHAKNTARLLKLCIPNVKLTQGRCSHDFHELYEHYQSTKKQVEWSLLYPSDLATPLETYKKNIHSKPLGLIVLDGTWKQAYRLMHLCPWIKHIPQVSFKNPPKSIYNIRKTDVKNSLSTLEAVAQALYLIESYDKSHPLRVLETRMRFFRP